VLSNLNSCPGIDFPMAKDSSFSDLLQVYDQVGDHWMASLPLKLPNLSRLSKFKIARKIAVELCLSSVGVSLRNKYSQAIEPSDPETGKLSLPILSKAYELSREESPSSPSSQVTQGPSQDSGFGLPTPARTPSLYSHASGTSTEPIEDLAILRLRQYALSIKSPPKMGKSALLSHWPPLPGMDPAEYKWEPVQKSSMEDDTGEVNDYRERRGEARRRRRTERFLNRERVTVSEVASRPAFTSFGSQPEIVQHATSSQTVDEFSMTQPDRGLFGSRSVQPGKKKQKKQKKRRAAGF
jgi:RNA polymerase I-specific transcription initiation factor RRN6